MYEDPQTGEIRKDIAKISYKQDAIIDMILANPRAKQRELADLLSVTPGWLSTLMGSDAFQVRLEERRKALVDPVIIASIEDRLRGVAHRALEQIQTRLDDEPPLPILLDVGKFAVQALGYGARPTNAPGQNGGVVFNVNLPGPQKSEVDWAARHAPLVSEVVDVAPKSEVVPLLDHENPP